MDDASVYYPSSARLHLIEARSITPMTPQMNLWPDTANTLKRVILPSSTCFNTFLVSGIEFIRCERLSRSHPRMRDHEYTNSSCPPHSCIRDPIREWLLWA